MATASLTVSQLSAISGLSAFSSVLSLCGSTFVICCYLAFPRLRKLSFSLVFLLAVSDWWNQIFDLISPSADELALMEANPNIVTTTCMAQAVGDNFFELSSVLFTTAIAWTLHQTVMYRKQIEDSWRNWAKYCAVCYGVPLILTIAPGAAGAFGATGSECWIKADQVGWKFGVFFVPLWIAITYNAVVYFRVLKLLKRTVAMAGPTDPVAMQIQALSARLSVYPFILAVIWILPSINMIVEAATKQVVFGLVLVSAFVAGLQGFFNSMAYGFSPGIRDALANTVGCRYICKRCGNAGQKLCCVGGGGGGGGNEGGAGEGGVGSPAAGSGVAAAALYGGASSAPLAKNNHYPQPSTMLHQEKSEASLLAPLGQKDGSLLPKALLNDVDLEASNRSIGATAGAASNPQSVVVALDDRPQAAASAASAAGGKGSKR